MQLGVRATITNEMLSKLHSAYSYLDLKDGKYNLTDAGIQLLPSVLFA